MSASGDLGGLSSLDWKNLEERADSLEEAWKRDEAVDLSEFLPSGENPARAAILHELIKTDLECRWRRGKPVKLEYYLEKFPEDLGSTETLPASLVYEEFRVRQTLGDRAPLEQYETRFPNQFEEVQRLVKQHTIRTDVSAPHPPAPRPTPAPAPPKAPEPLEGIPATFSKNLVLPQIGGFTLIERIGRGGFAEVWKAKAPGGVLKAIKIIIRPIDQAEATREVEAMDLIKNLRHHFLLPVHSYWPLEDRLIIMMDLADGSLRDCLNEARKQGQQAIALPELMRYFRQAAEALDYLHGKKVQHRDIKPENILLVDNNVRVADFGLAKDQGTKRMVTGTFAGTPLYMPPETWNDKTHIHGDQYSLAATYFELRAGRRLYKDAGLPSLMQSHLHEKPVLDPLRPAEQQVLLKALSKNPEERYSSCMEFMQHLERAVAPEMPLGPVSMEMGMVNTLGGSDTEMNTIHPGQVGKPSWARPDTFRDPATVTGPGTAGGRSRVGWLVTFLATFGFLAAVAWIVLGPLLQSREFSLEPLAPQAVHAGEMGSFPLLIKRTNLTEPVELKFAEDPDVRIEAEPIAGDAVSVPIKVTVADKAPAGARKIAFAASAGDRRLEGVLELVVKPLATLPRGALAGVFRPVEGTDVVMLSNTSKVRKYYKHIECLVGAKPVRFVLIEGRDQGRRPYYMMVDKVWNSLFAAFAASRPQEVRWSRWPLGARVEREVDFLWAPEMLVTVGSFTLDRWGINLNFPVYAENPHSLPHPGDLGVKDGNLPVLRVEIEEAHRCCEWLGGSLPSVNRWDKAAGRHENNPGEGPFLTDWVEGEIAVRRPHLGPMAAGQASKDRSPLGCHDMSGNGLEWTSTYQDDVPGMFAGDVSRIPPYARVVLRGRDYAHNEPLRFRDLDEGPVTFPFFEDKRDLNLRPLLAHIGFRVVLEVDP
jgi:formylglycine-generating enzyme required for sulfatase activity